MDDTTNQAQQQPVQPQPQPIVPTVTSGTKEAMPIPAKPVSEFATDKEPVLPQEVKEAGVETRGETLIVPEEAAIEGLEPAKESVVPPANPNKIVWPITAEKAQNTLKVRMAILNSITWLSTVITKVLKKRGNNANT